MEIVAKKYVDEANSLIETKTYLEYFNYFKTLKLKHIINLYEKAAAYYESANLLGKAADCYIFSATYYIETNELTASALNHFKAGETYHKVQNYQKSIISYLMAIEQKPDPKFTIKCYNNLAENYFALGNYADCIKSFEMCITTNIKMGRDDLNFDFYDKLGIIYCTCLKKYAIAITVYDKLVELLRKRGDISLPIYCFIAVLLRILANNDDMEYAKKYMESLDEFFVKSEYADYLRNIFVFSETDASMLEKFYKYYGERIPGLDNVNVKLLINTIHEKYI